MLRLASLLAVVALATAIPSLNLPTVAPAHGFNTTAAAFEDKVHSEFVAWKSKVSNPRPPLSCAATKPPCVTLWGAGARLRTGAHRPHQRRDPCCRGVPLRLPGWAPRISVLRRDVYSMPYCPARR